jgi:hypothetical protein
MEYKFVIKELESSLVPEGISAPKKHFDKKCLRSNDSPVK